MSLYVVEGVTQSFTHCLEHNWIISAWLLLSTVTDAYIIQKSVIHYIIQKSGQSILFSSAARFLGYIRH